jgi:chemotaxis protein CheD
MDDKFIDVDTGEVSVSSKPVVLRVMAIGSCVVVAVYNRHKKIGGLAHIMLPGKSQGREGEHKTKYAEDAIDILLDTSKKVGVRAEDLEVNLVGGADILGEGSISKEVVDSVLGYLKKLDIEPKNKRIGGTKRRSVSLDVESGRIFYTEGDSTMKEL